MNRLHPQQQLAVLLLMASICGVTGCFDVLRLPLSCYLEGT